VDPLFALYVKEWQSAESEAAEAELRLQQLLDAYCDGLGPAPSRTEIAQTLRLRRVARLNYAAALACLRRAHRDVEVI